MLPPPSGPTHEQSAPTTRLNARQRRHLRRRQHALAQLRQIEWAKGSPDAQDMAPTARPGSDPRTVEKLSRELRGAEDMLAERRLPVPHLDTAPFKHESMRGSS